MPFEKCPACKGTGRCRTCRGKGVMVIHGGSETELCMDCDGTGQCDACYGTGTLPLDELTEEE